MSNNHKQEQKKLVEISFDCKSLGCSLSDKSIFGIQVKPNGKSKLVGQCDPEVKKALSDAGKCD